jgi:hypothetical protein
LGFTGGLAFHLLGLPLPWLTGPAAVVAAAALLGTKVGLMRWLCEAAIVLLGVTLGSTVTPETLSMAARWPLTMAGLAAAVVSIMTLGSIYLQRVHGLDRATARLSAIPGALNYVLALAVESNSDPRRVVIIQVVRLTAILLFLPPLLQLFGADLTVGFARPNTADYHLGELVILLAAGALAAVLFWRFGAPAPSLFGSMLAAAVLYGSGLLTSSLPIWLVLPGFLVLGSMIGSNFAGTDARLFIDTLWASFGLLAVSAAAALAWAFLLNRITGLSTIQLWLAYAPGGVETTAIMALSLGLDAAFVSGHHVARVLFLSVLVPIWIRRDLKGSGDDGDGAGRG